MAWRLGKHFESGDALFSEFLDEPLQLQVISMNEAWFICEPTLTFWGHWSGTNREILKREGVSVRKRAGDWRVCISKGKVLNGTDRT